MKRRISQFFVGEGRTATIKRNVFGSLIIRGVSILASFLLVPLTIDFVSPELYGVWLTLSSILIWMGFLDLGFSQGLKNKLTEAIAENDWNRGRSLVSTTYFMLGCIFIPFGIIMQFLIPRIDWVNLLNVSPQYESDVVLAMRVLIGFCCVQLVLNVLSTVLAAFQRVAFSNLFHVIGNVAALLVILFLTRIASPSLFLLSFVMSSVPVVVYLVASACLYSGGLKQVTPSINSIRLDYVKDLFSLGYKFFIINVQIIVLYQSTNVLISNVSSPLEVTNYNIAYKYLNMAMMVFSIITSPLWPAYTDAYIRKDFSWMKDMHKKMTKVLLCSICGCAVLVAVSNPFYHFWVGDSVNVPFMMTLMVAIYVCIYCSMNLNSTLVVGMGKIQMHTYIVIFGMIAHIPVSLFFSKFWGPYGVLFSMILINVLYAIVFHVQVKKLLSNSATGIWNK